MKKILVTGYAEVQVSIVVGVDDNATEEEMLDEAYAKFGGIHQFVGNGGTDKLIGVSGHCDQDGIGEESISAHYADVTFNKCEEAQS